MCGGVGTAVYGFQVTKPHFSRMTHNNKNQLLFKFEMRGQRPHIPEKVFPCHSSSESISSLSALQTSMNAHCVRSLRLDYQAIEVEVNSDQERSLSPRPKMIKNRIEVQKNLKCAAAILSPLSRRNCKIGSRVWWNIYSQ